MIKSSLSTCSLLTILTLTALLSLPQVARAADLAGCEENLKKSLCYAEPVTHWALASAENLTDNVKRYQDRACLPAPESVFKKMVDVYRLFPVEVQKSFCEIKRIFIVKGKTDFGAVAEYYFDIKTLKAKTGEWTSSLSAKPTGYLMEISEQNRFGGETASNYLSRVLQARFGQASKNGLAKDLPIATYKTPFGNDGALATTIVHEIGHMLSRAQRVTNSFFETKSETAWTQLSWKFDGSSFTAATIDEDFQQRIRAKELKRADLRSTLRFMKKSAIPTLYAATGVEEEFAEQFMFNYYDDLKWTLDGDVVLDLREEFKSNPAFKAKRDFIRKLMKDPKPFSTEKFGAVQGDLQLL